jgi:PAS domain S-box-containing protein
MRHTGIEIIGDVPWGTHFCQFYENQRDLTDVLIPYFRAGLENNEFCMWVTSEPLRADQARAALGKAIGNLDDYLAKGQIEIIDYRDWYVSNGKFVSGRVLQAWVEKLHAARARGFDGLRLTGNTFWLEKPDWRDFTEYEATVDSVIGEHPMLALCTYSLAKCGVLEIMDVVANHAFALIQRAGKWELIESAERKRMEAFLRKSEERYASMFLRMTEGFALHEIICDESGVPCDYRFLEVNPAFERLTGLTRGQIIGKTVRQVLPEEDPSWVRIYGQVALTGKPVHFDNYAPQLQRHYDVVAYRPAPRQFAVLITDVTERKRAEQTIRESEEKRNFAQAAQLERQRFYDILNSLPVMICLLTPDYHVPFANRPFREMFGEGNGRTCYNSIFGFSEPCAQCESLVPLRTGLPHRWVNPCPGGRFVEAYDIPFTDVDGSRLILEVDVDITERRRMEEQLRAASLYARTLLEASLDPLITISPDGTITDVNRATEIVTGIAREELIGSRFSSHFTESQKAEEGYRKVLAEGLVQDYPLTIRDVSGSLTDVLFNATVYRNEAGEVEGVFAAARDVTARKRAEAELSRYRDHLEDLVRQRTGELETATAELARSNRELEQFAYVASHDLQEPLRAVTGYLGLLRKQLGDKLNEKAQHQIAGAVEGSERMNRLITDLLALSRVGTRNHAFEPVALDTALDHALDSLNPGIGESGARIVRDPLPTLPVDAGQIAQVFQNLIGNAIKFRGERPPEIHIGARQGEGEWIFAVRDNGIGIEPQYFERVFLIFQRLHTRAHYPGTGIGLAICKKIVERHGGRIWVESQPGLGSTFYFALPAGERHEHS